MHLKKHEARLQNFSHCNSKLILLHYCLIGVTWHNDHKYNRYKPVFDLEFDEWPWPRGPKALKFLNKFWKKKNRRSTKNSLILFNLILRFIFFCNVNILHANRQGLWSLFLGLIYVLCLSKPVMITNPA